MTTLRTLSIRLDPVHGVSTPHWAAAIQRLARRLCSRLRSPYRPERHYMRGPGPACMAKWQRPAAKAVSPG